MGGELGAGALGGDPPGAQHIATVGDLERAQGVLLDDEDGAALLAQLDEQVEDRVDHHRGEAERRLVEQDEAGVAHQRPGDGELLGLAAREVAGGGVPPAVEDVEAGAGLVEAAAAFSRSRGDAGELQVLTDGEVAEDPPVLGHEGEPGPHERRRLGARDVRCPPR